jgi:23S rRNA (guanosine2251-2'-O)-methyltransferase
MSDLIYGLQPVSALLTQEPHRLLEVFIAIGRINPRLQPIVQTLQAQGIALQHVHPAVLSSQSGGAAHQGVVARIRPQPLYDERQLPALLETPAPLLLVLDGITDPHNLGACLRSADAAGVRAVIIPRDRSVHYNATVSKVACGAAERVPLLAVTNLARTLRDLQTKGVWVVGTSDQAVPLLYQQELTGALALVMGAEGQGLRRLTQTQCDVIVRLPMQGSVASLNVSVATGICLFEAVRQRTSTIIP